MTKAQARALARRIQETDLYLRVTGYRFIGGAYGVDARNMASGFGYVFWSEQEWRKQQDIEHEMAERRELSDELAALRQRKGNA